MSVDSSRPGPCESADISSGGARGGRQGGACDGHRDHSHGHGHGHGHAHVHRTGDRARDRRRLLATLVLTLTMMVGEAIGGWYSGSLALLSDAGHMLTDATALLLAFVALLFATRPADLKRTYGFFRLEVLSALINGLTLIAIAAVIGWEAWQRISDPQEIKVGVMLVVAAFGLVINLGGMMLLSRSSSMNVRGAFLHVAGDALSSVGVLIAGAVAWFTGWTLLDPIISVVIALVILVGAIGLVRQAVHVLIEAVPEHIDLVEVFRSMREIEGVDRVHDLHVWTISQGMNALSAHLVVSADLANSDRDRILLAAREALKERFGISHATLQIESETFAQLDQAH